MINLILFTKNIQAVLCHMTHLDQRQIYFGRVLSFIFSEPLKRLSLCAYWVCVICVSVLRFYNISKNSKIERILLRKYYHLMAVLMFVPALIFQVIQINDRLSSWYIFSFFILVVMYIDMLIVFLFQPKFLDLSFGAALAVFLALEIIRVSCQSSTSHQCLLI